MKRNTWEEYIILNIPNLQSIQAYFHVISISSSYSDWWFLKTYRSTGDDYMMATPYKKIFSETGNMVIMVVSCLVFFLNTIEYF